MNAEERYVAEARPEHTTDGYTCWCGPQVEQVCPECGGEGGEVKCECWRCAGDGMIPCSDPDAYDGPFGLLVIHNDVLPP